MHRLCFCSCFGPWGPGGSKATCPRPPRPWSSVYLEGATAAPGDRGCRPWYQATAPTGRADRAAHGYWDTSAGGPYAGSVLARQRKMAKLARAAMVYTPQVLLRGRISATGVAAFEQAVAKSMPGGKGADFYSGHAAKGNHFTVEATAELGRLRRLTPRSFWAPMRNKLVSEVKAGENRPDPAHDYVSCNGPAARVKGTAVERQRWRCCPGGPEHSGRGRFRAERASGEVCRP